MNYLSIYTNLCNRGQLRKSQYKPFSGLHEHHILPKHSGGQDNLENLTYLTLKEHKLAHLLLWKLYGAPNDLRARKMLNGNLTPEHRKIIGEYCRDNKIGFHGFSKEERTIWAQRGRENQLDKNGLPVSNSWMYWSSPTGRKERASLGGKASLENGNNEKFLYWMSKEGRQKRASLGGKSHIGKKWVNNGIHRTRVTPDKLEEYLNKGYRLGATF